MVGARRFLRWLCVGQFNGSQLHLYVWTLVEFYSTLETFTYTVKKVQLLEELYYVAANTKEAYFWRSVPVVENKFKTSWQCSIVLSKLE